MPCRGSGCARIHRHQEVNLLLPHSPGYTACRGFLEGSQSAASRLNFLRLFSQTIYLWCCYIKWLFHTSEQKCPVLLLLLFIHLNFIHEYPESQLLSHYRRSHTSLAPSAQWPAPTIQKPTGYPFRNGPGQMEENQKTPCHYK